MSFCSISCSIPRKSFPTIIRKHDLLERANLIRYSFEYITVLKHILTLFSSKERIISSIELTAVSSVIVSTNDLLKQEPHFQFESAVQLTINNVPAMFFLPFSFYVVEKLTMIYSLAILHYKHVQLSRIYFREIR